MRSPRPNRVLAGSAAAAALVVLSTLFAVPVLQDAATRTAVPFARMDQPLFYLLGAPLFGLWDSLSVLTLSQHYAVLGTFLCVHILWRLTSRRRGGFFRRAWAEGIRGLGALLLLLGFYAGGILLPRPMTGIVLGEPDLLAVNFHSHTNHSHDGWSRFTAARNRGWHEGGGFNAAYITDHYTWAGVDDAAPDNPPTAGEGTVLLSGAELRLRGRHTNVLGDHTRYAFALDSTWHYLNTDSISAAYLRGGPAPAMLYTIPGPLDQIVPFTPDFPAGVIGVELNDGAPRGLEQGRAEWSEILALADSMDLAVVAGANIHGWGRTAVAWSVLRVPGWRNMTTSDLSSALEAILHRDRREAVTVIERRMPYHEGSVFRLAVTVPWLLWEHFRMLSLRERLSWLLWSAVFAWLGRRTRGSTRS